MNKEPANYSAYRFLIADDRAFLRSMVQSILIRCQARDIKHAADGAEAMKVLTQTRGTIDCVLCDWNMEPVDGLTLLKAIRAGDIRHVPRDMCVIMLTGHANEAVVKTAVSMGANGYVVKPVSMEKLIRAIDNGLAKKVELKPADDYRSISTVSLPGTVLSPVKRVPPWTLWSKMRVKALEEMTKRIEQIREEGERLLHDQSEVKRPVTNKQRTELDAVPPGKVLAEDIIAEDGTLLLASGIVLNESLLMRLKELAADSTEPVHLTIGDFED